MNKQAITLKKKKSCMYDALSSFNEEKKKEASVISFFRY